MRYHGIVLYVYFANWKIWYVISEILQTVRNIDLIE